MQRYFAHKKNNNYFSLSSDDLYHIKTVMRLKDGDSIEVVYNNKAYICMIEDNQARVVKEMDEKIDKNRITLVIPLLKEAKMDLILQKSTELGVDRIIPIIMERSIIKISDDKMSKKILRWQRILKEASEQSKRLDIPLLEGIKTFDDLKDISGLKLIGSTNEKKNNLKKVLKNNKEDITVVIGPEGGLTLKEETLLESYGFIKVSFGPRILRVETAPLFVLSVLNYESME